MDFQMTQCQSHLVETELIKSWVTHGTPEELVLRSWFENRRNLEAGKM